MDSDANHREMLSHGAHHSVLHNYREGEKMRIEAQKEIESSSAAQAAKLVPPIGLDRVDQSSLDKENLHEVENSKTKHSKRHAKDHGKAKKNHGAAHQNKHSGSSHHGHHHHKGHHHKGHRHKTKEKHKHAMLPPTAPSPPQRRLSATFQPVSWSDFAAVERKLTAEALAHVNEPSRVEELRKEAIEEAKLLLESNAVWSLAEDRILISSRAFAIQESFETIQQRIMELPHGKRRSLGSLQKRVLALMRCMPRCSVPGESQSKSKHAEIMDEGKSKQSGIGAVFNDQNERTLFEPDKLTGLDAKDKALAQRGNMLRHDLILEFLQRGTGFALSQGVRESDLAGDSDDLARKTEAAERKRKRLVAAGQFVVDPNKPAPNLSSDMMLLCGRQAVQVNKKALTHASPLMNAVIKNDEAAVHTAVERLGLERKPFDPLLRYDPTANGIRINTESPECDGIDMFGCWDKPIVSRFAKFVADPVMVERSEMLRNSSVKQAERVKELRLRCTQQIEMERQEATAKLREAQEQEAAELREYLEDQKKAEIEAVQSRHQQIRLAEEDHLRERHRDQANVINVHYDEEVARAKKLGSEPAKSAANRKKKELELKHNEQAIADVLGGADSMRLLFLSEFVGAADLTDACARVLSENRPAMDYSSDKRDSKHGDEEMGERPALVRRAPPLLDYLDGPGKLVRIFQSSVISEATIIKIVQHLSTRALMALEAKYSSGETSEKLMVRVRKELKCRRVMVKNTYEHLTHEGLNVIKQRADVFVKQLQKNGGAFFMDELFVGNSNTSSNSLVNKGDDSMVTADADGETQSLQEIFDEPPFVDVLEEEIQRRRRAYLVCFNPETLPDTLSLSYDRMRVTLEHANRYATAQATIPRQSGELGCWMFEVEIVTLPPIGCNISIGFDVPLRSMSWRPNGSEMMPCEPLGKIQTIGQIGGRGVAFPGHSKDDHGRCGYAWQGDGRARSNSSKSGAGGMSMKSGIGVIGTPQPYGALHVAGRTFTAPSSFAVGDVIGVCLDQDYVVPRIVFYRNGRRVRLGNECEKYLRDLARANAWKERRKHIDVGAKLSSDDVPIVNRDYVLVPAVCLYSANRMPDRESKPCVRANFKGPFQFPQSGYEPYGGMPSAGK